MGNGFDFVDFPNPQIGPPLVVAEQGIVVRAEITRIALSECGPIEHLAKRGAIGIAGMHTKADEPPGELVHDNQDPVGLEENGLAPEQVDAPEAILHVTDKGES